jgi:hypothetical protein
LTPFAEVRSVRAMESAQMRPDGWITFNHEGADGLHVRVRRDGEQYVVTDLYVHGPQVTANLLRALQPARIEAELTLSRKEGSPVLQLAEQFPQDRLDAKLTVAELRKRAAHVKSRRARRRRPLPRPEGMAPEVFYAKVADAYRSAATETSRPAPVLADEAGVPVETVRRWIKEARRRGFLPAGRKGRAG